MKILSHRGYWIEPHEKNQRAAFERTIACGFGTETDVRDCAGQLVISHDPPTTGALRLDEVLDRFTATSSGHLPLAMNIKADGLAARLAEAFDGRGLDWFVFDMSFPDLLQQLKVGNPVFGRMSEYEALPPDLVGRLRGVWLDAFTSEWFGTDTIVQLLEQGLEVCVVSPELHGRPHQALWEKLQPLAAAAGLMLCTDLPEEASRLFEHRAEVGAFG
jgi:glycerophosphoryl diester phosphodiesterase